MDLITAWNPYDPQWWICSFNPNVRYEDNPVENQVMIGSVDFSKHNEYDENGEVVNKMYEAFEMKYKNNISFNRYIIYDNDNKTIWLCWCEGKLI
ncbi:MAG: hypothetical protein ACI4KH_02130 [Oscillospiraceae bacterium]